MALSFEEQLNAITNRFQTTPGGLMPLLHEVRNTFGHVPSEAVKPIAKAMNLSRAEVHGVISFYHDFHTSPQCRTTVQVCRAEACQAMGSRQLENHAKQKLGVDFGETTENKEFTLEPVYCLGNCACGPSVRINDDVHARVSADRFDRLLELYGGEAE
jgi:formate dehydrogenase subunit gamma